MSCRKLFTIALLINAIVLCCLHECLAGTMSISSTGNTGAMAGTDDYGQAVAMSGPVGVPQQSSGGYSSGGYSGGGYSGGGSSGGGYSGGGSSGSGSAGLLSRSGGSPSKSQSVLVGTNGNGDTTILQQSGDQPAKVYKISGSG